MANGKQLAEQNFQTFTVWLCSRTDDDFRRLVSRGILSRKEIAAQCQFALSVLNQNPRVKAALSNKESELRLAGILPAVADKIEDVAVTGTKRAEVSSTNKTNGQLKREFERIAILQDFLYTTGRLPR
jgi:hypothetical protein